MNTRKQQLINDIQQLLNSHQGVEATALNPELLEFMDETSLIGIIDSLLAQKESYETPDTEWLSQFKKDENS